MAHAQCKAELPVSDKWLLADVRAVAKGVSVERDVTGDGACIEGAEEKGVPAWSRGAVGVAAGPDQIGAKIGRQFPAGA